MDEAPQIELCDGSATPGFLLDQTALNKLQHGLAHRRARNRKTRRQRLFIKHFTRCQQSGKDFVFDRGANRTDRKSVVEGKGVSVRVDLGGRRLYTNKRIATS